MAKLTIGVKAKIDKRLEMFLTCKTSLVFQIFLLFPLGLAFPFGESVNEVDDRGYFVKCIAVIFALRFSGRRGVVPYGLT